MRQLDAEFRRFWARRVVRGAFLFAALIIVVAVTIGTVRGKPGSERVIGTTDMTIVGPAGPTIDGEEFPDDAPVYEYPDYSYTITSPDTRMNVGKDLADVLEGVGITMMFVAFVLGASFIGGEFNVGSLTSQLLFEPRRVRVHLAKGISVGAGIALLSLAISVLVAIAMYIGSEAKGVVEGVDGAFWWDRFGDTMRIAGAVGIAGMLAYGVTVVAKRTAAGVVIFLAQFPLINIISPTSRPFGWLSQYNPVRALLAVISDPGKANPMFFDGIRTMAGGVALTLLWLLVVMGVSGAIFSRAEVR